MVNRKELRSKIPKGYCKIIADKAGVTNQAVSSYFSAKINSEKVEIAALEVVAQLKQERLKLIGAAGLLQNR